MRLHPERIRIILTGCVLGCGLLAPAQVPQDSATARPSQPSQASPDSEKQSPPEGTPATLPDSTVLEPIKIEKANYPWEARDKQLQGQVWVKIVVSETGDVASAEVTSGDPVLAKAALDAVKKWKFKPFIKHGKPASVSANVPFDFAFTENVHKEKEPPLNRTPPNPSTSGNVNSQAASTVANPGPNRIPIRVAQGVTQGLLIYKVQPVYPPEARRAGIEGTVVLQAEIGKDGRIIDLKLLSGPKELAEAAIGAVQQWRYRPYTLNGEPVVVQTQIQVNFTLRRF
jgi:protein TonB